MASQQGGGGARPKTPRQGSGPTQQASAPTKEGWLFEPAGTTLFGLVKRQKRRYCVLEGQSRLVIYKGRSKTKVKAVLHLQQAVNATRQKRRYCVLDGHSWLVIYKDRTNTNVEAVYLLQQILDVTATVPSSHVFEIRMTRDDPPLVLASRDQADMLDWMGALNGAISFANGPAPHEDVPSQGLTDPTTCQQPQARDTAGRTDPSTCQQPQARDTGDRTDPSTCQQPQARDTENTTDSSTCQQSGLSDAEDCLNEWERCFPGHTRPCCRGYKCKLWPWFTCFSDPGSDPSPRACQGAAETCLPHAGNPCCHGLVCQDAPVFRDGTKRCGFPASTTPTPCAEWQETCGSNVVCCDFYLCMTPGDVDDYRCTHPAGR